jgi:hypothetical protein
MGRDRCPLKFKEQIEDAIVEECMDVIKSIKIKHFHYSEEYRQHFDLEDKQMLGVIADELKQVDAECVKEAPMKIGEVEYQDFKSPLPYTIAFHPYYLKQYNNRWFIFGYNELTKNEYWNMALDRIKTVEEGKTEYNEIEIDWEDYFYDIIGVTKKIEDEMQTVKLWFSPSQAPYVITKPIHPTQKCKNTENGLEVTISVVPNYELEKLILSFGETVKVLSPESFQKKIIDRIKKCDNLY